MMRSMSAGVEAGRAERRARPRWLPRSRWSRLRRRCGAGWMPVRWTIHSSEVSTVAPARHWRRRAPAGSADAAHDERTKRSGFAVSPTGRRRRGSRMQVMGGQAVQAGGAERAGAGGPGVADHVANFAEQILAHHVVANPRRRRKPRRRRRHELLMTTPSRPRNTPPLSARVDLARAGPERLAREQRADARQRLAPIASRMYGRSAGRCLRRSSARCCR